MRSRFATSADDSSDDYFGNLTHDFSGNAAGDGSSPALPSFSAWAGAFNERNWGTPIPVSALTGEAQQAMAAQSGPVNTVSVSMGTGFTINLLYDAAAMAAPQSFRNTIQQAANLLAASITDPITVNIKIDYSGTGGGAAAGPDAGLYEPYSLVRSNLIANVSPGDPVFNSLPAGTSIQGQSQVAVWNAQLKLWGLLSPNDATTDDGSATFATDIAPNLLLGVALHELTHAMGRVPYGPQPDIFDLFRFTSSGVRLFNGAATAPAAYFSLDNGVTKLADYGKTSDSSDFLNSGIQGSNDPFNEFYSGTTLQKLTTVDLKQMDALGFHLKSTTGTVIESFGMTSLVQVGNNYYLEDTNTGLGPVLKVGAPVVVGQFNPWTFIGAEQTSTGYEVALRATGTQSFSIWNTDSNGNYISNGPVLLGTSVALESLENSFHQDLNGDGVMGLPANTHVIESFGVTSLVQVGNNYYLEDTNTGLGPVLKVGAPVVVGQFNPWTFIGAEQTSTGYEVALRATGTQSFSIWNTDSNGNYISNGPTLLGTSVALESLENSFHQDLNGDGVVGLPPNTHIIESAGSTSLVQLGTNYYLEDSNTGFGPVLKAGGVPVVVGQFNPWTVVGAEQTATGYEVALRFTGTQYFSIWATDSNGNYVSNGPVLLGDSAALQTLETSFRQDLNGDGFVGVPSPAPAVPQLSALSANSLDHFSFNSSVTAGAATSNKIDLSEPLSGMHNVQLASDFDASSEVQEWLRTAGDGHGPGSFNGHDHSSLPNPDFLHGDGFLIR